MKLFGEGTILTPRANMIMDEDLDYISNEIKCGWNINEEFEICKNIKEIPIILALYYNKLKVVDFLIKNHADLNLKKKSVIVAAADSCTIDTIKLLINHGAQFNNEIGFNAITRALINERYDLMLEFINMGIDIKKNGTILRRAVSEKQYPAIKILLNQNIDVNFHTPDGVFPYNPTTVLIAAEKDDFDTVKLLVENGADITIKDEYGERPFLAAQKNKNKEMMEYIKALEPEEWHNEEQKLKMLKSYKLPQKLIDFLRGKDLRLEIENNENVSYIVFNSLVNCKEVTWNGYKFLDLLNEVDNYLAEGFLVWYPLKKCLASVDYEHEKFIILDKWDKFTNNPSKIINKIFE